jgi:hypothetical protein
MARPTKAQTANKEAQKRFNDSQTAQGKKRIEVRAHPDDELAIKNYVKKLNKKRGL